MIIAKNIASAYAINPYFANYVFIGALKVLIFPFHICDFLALRFDSEILRPLHSPHPED